MDTFGSKLKKVRQEARMTLEETAERSGYSRQYLSALEHDRPNLTTGKPVTPKRNAVIAIATALNWDEQEASKLAHGCSKETAGTVLPLMFSHSPFPALSVPIVLHVDIKRTFGPLWPILNRKLGPQIFPSRFVQK